MTGSRTPGPATPFDDLSETYDAEFGDSALGSVLREAVWRRLERYLSAGQTALDLGCGTGIDAARLAAAGMRVVAIDASQRMVATAQRRCHHLGERVHVVQGDMNRTDFLTDLSGPFALTLSNFGALNCAVDLASVMASVAREMSAESAFIAVVMGRYVPWEWFWMAGHGKPRAAFRRLSPSGVRWRDIRIQYYSPRMIRRLARSAGLEVRRIAGLGAALPITEAARWISRSPRLLKLLNDVERSFETAPIVPWLADHLLVEMVKP